MLVLCLLRIIPPLGPRLTGCAATTTCPGKLQKHINQDPS